MKPYQQLTDQYYRISGKTYQQLCPEGTDFMNLGLWPAQNLLEAQRLLYENLAIKTATYLSDEAQLNIIEIGSGWGAGSQVLTQIFKNANYTGVNLSTEQVAYAKSKYGDEKVTFVNSDYESFQPLVNNQNPTIYFGVETLLHCLERQKFISNLKLKGINILALAEIVIDKSALGTEPLFYPALSFAADINEYAEIFKDLKISQFEIVDISQHVFSGWLKALQLVSRDSFRAQHRKIFTDFIAAYHRLDSLAAAGLAKYNLIIARLN